MQLSDYVAILRRRWWLILVLIAAGGAGAGYSAKTQTPTYTASTQLIVNGSSGLSAADELATRQLADDRAAAFAQIAGTAPALEAALVQAEKTSGPFSAAGSPSVSVGASGKDPFIYVRVTDTDPRRAQAVANAYVKTLPGVIHHLEQTPVASPEEISVVSPAGLPGVSSHLKRDVAIGVAAGAVVGVALALLLEALDRRMRDPSQVEDAAGLPVLGTIPYELAGERLPASSSPMSVRAEAYRKVRTNLAFLTESGPPKSVVVTSAVAGEGKTSLSTNLALTCAASGQRVLLIDADLRRPMVHEYVGLANEVGLVDVLAGRSSVSEATVELPGADVQVLPSGAVPANPSELLGSARMIELLRTAEVDYDIVIVDSPPVLPVADALVIGVEVDGVVLVTRLGETTPDKLQEAKASLERVRANILGVVPNAAKDAKGYGYSYRYKKRGSSEPQYVPVPGADPAAPEPVGAPPAPGGSTTAAHFPSTADGGSAASNASPGSFN